MAALGGDPRSFQAGRPGSDHHDLLRRTGSARDHMRHRRFAAGRRVVDAERFATFVDAVEAIGRADAGPDEVLLAAHHLGDDVRIGDMRAGHADHVELARGDRMAGGGNIGDTRGMEDRELRRLANFAGEVEMRRRWHAGDRDNAGERRIRVDHAADDVEEVEFS